MSKGADLDATTSRAMSAVHLAAEAGEASLIRMLLAAGVSVIRGVGKGIKEAERFFFFTLLEVVWYA